MQSRFPDLTALLILASFALASGCGRSTEAISQAQTPSNVSPNAETAGATASPTQSAESTQAPRVLQAAINSIEARSSVSARIREQVNLFDRQLVGSGDYFQQRTDAQPLIRLELRLQLGDQQSSLLQVLSPPTPEGQFLWTSRKLPDEESLTRIDLARAAKALEKSETLPGVGGQGMLSGLGGLPKLLRGLQAAFDFDAAETGRFGRLTVWRLQGRWKPERLAQILPDQKAAIEAGGPIDLSQLPEQLPDRVVLMLGCDDLFPYRVEYRRAIPQSARQPGQTADSRALVTMELFDVKLDLPIDATRFIYNPSGIDFSDETDALLESLGAAP